MRIAITSGKSGTGKTTVAVNLAAVLARLGHHVCLLDCNVEGPNCHTFLDPEFYKSETIQIKIPKVDEVLCKGCGTCAEVCEKKAILLVKGFPVVYPERCIYCGSCVETCPQNAITEKEETLGVVESGFSKKMQFAQGRSQIKGGQAPALVDAVRRHRAEDGITIKDFPPGLEDSSALELEGVDYVVLVVEPTAEGLEDLKSAINKLREKNIPFGVVLNKGEESDPRFVHFCRKEKISLLQQIPNDLRMAASYSRRKLAVEEMPELRHKFESIYSRIQESLCP